LRSNSSSSTQEIPHILRSMKAHYHIYNSLPLVPNLSQISPVHILPTKLLIHFNIILHLQLGLPHGLFPYLFCTKTLCASLLSKMCHMPCPLHSFSLITQTIFNEQCTLFASPLSPHSSEAQISSSAPYSKTPSAHVPPTMFDTKFHTHTKQQYCIF